MFRAGGSPPRTACYSPGSRRAPALRRRQPDVVDYAAALNIRDFEGGFFGNHDIRIDLPARSEIAGGGARRAFLQRTHSALAGFAGKVFRADGAAFRVADLIERRQVQHGFHPFVI